jgi:hypothetical protein
MNVIWLICYKLDVACFNNAELNALLAARNQQEINNTRNEEVSCNRNYIRLMKMERFYKQRGIIPNGL